ASVPSQCARVGGLNWAAKSVSRGWYGAMMGEVMAPRIMTTIIAAPAAPRGQRRANLIPPRSQRGRGRTREAWATAAMGVFVCIIGTECVDRASRIGGPRRNSPGYTHRLPGAPGPAPAYSPDGPQTARTAGRCHSD